MRRNTLIARLRIRIRIRIRFRIRIRIRIIDMNHGLLLETLLLNQRRLRQCCHQASTHPKYTDPMRFANQRMLRGIYLHLPSH